MRWFKHMTNAANDEKLAKLKDKFGLEGYGFWWNILEIIAANMDEKCRSSAEFSEKKWGNLLGISPKKFRIMAEFCANLGLFFIKNNGNYISIDIPNLLKLRDEYTEKKVRKSGQNPDTLQPLLKDTDTDIDKEILNTPPLTPRKRGEGC